MIYIKIIGKIEDTASFKFDDITLPKEINI